MDLWNQEIEEKFFQEAIDDSISTEQLFYVTKDNRYLAYWPKNHRGTRSTLQGRNARIGEYTETWTKELLEGCVKDENVFVVKGAVCREIGLSKRSPVDIAKKKKINLSLPQKIF